MNRSDKARNAYMLRGQTAKRGYMRWWHSFRGTLRGTEKARTFFVEYFLMNPGLYSSKIVLNGKQSSFCMIKAGAFPENGEPGTEMNAFYPISELRSTKDPFYVRMGDSTFSETHISGSVWISEDRALRSDSMTDSGTMEWDLDICKSIACHTGYIASPFFTALNALDSFWHGEGIKAQYSGTVVLNGEIYDISPETCYGYADKHWGRKYSQPWLVLAGNHLYSKKTGKTLNYSAFAIAGAYTRFFGLRLKKRLHIQLTYTGEDFEFTLAKPFRFCRMKWHRKATSKRAVWQIKATNRKAMIKCSISAPRDSLLPIEYKCPDSPDKKLSLKACGQGFGTIELYRMEKGLPVLLDTLTFENGLCEYQKNSRKR